MELIRDFNNLWFCEKLSVKLIFLLVAQFLHACHCHCCSVFQEIQAVFAAYGIHVDYRHLSLLADYMTFEGSYKPFNRMAIESNPSPLQQMSFEQTMKFLVQSSVKCRTDSLQSPSAQIVLGITVSCGTGCMDLFTPLTAF